MKQEFVLILITGLLILTYILDAIVNPLPIKLITPYHYFTPETMFKYAFTTTSIVLKTIALVITPIWLLSYTGFSKTIKGAVLLVISGLMQLYSLQDVVSGSNILPLEWSLSLTLTGMVLLIPAILYFILGFFSQAKKTITNDPYYIPDDDEII